MAAKRRPDHSNSWQQWTMRVAPPAVTAAALLAGWPSVSPAQTGWKWFGNQPPAATQPARPQTGFAAAVQRLMEQARTEAAAGDFDAALKTAERAHKIADAATGVLGRDPEFSPDVTRKFLNDMVALADASRGSSQAIATAKPRAAAAPVAPRKEMAQAAPVTKPQPAPVQRVVAAATPPAPLAPSQPKPEASLPVAVASTKPAANIVPQPAPVGDTEFWAEPIQVVPPKVPSQESTPPTSLSMFTILGGDSSKTSQIDGNRAPVPDLAALDNLPAETTPPPALARRQVTWSSRDASVGSWYDNSTPTAQETVVIVAAPAARESNSEPVLVPSEAGSTLPTSPARSREGEPLTFGTTFSLGEPVTSEEPAGIDVAPEPAIADVATPESKVAAASEPQAAANPAAEVYDFSFAVVAPAVPEPKTEPPTRPLPQSPYVVALDVEPFDVKKTTPRDPARETKPTETSQLAPEPVAAPAPQPESQAPVVQGVVEFAVDNALLVTSTPEPATKPKTANQGDDQTQKKTSDLVPAAVTSNAGGREFDGVVPTEWSSANPEHRVPKRRATRWVDPTWESTKPQVTEPAPETPTEPLGHPSAATEAVDSPVIMMTTFVQPAPASDPMKSSSGASSQDAAIQAVRELKSALSEQSRPPTGELLSGPVGILRAGSAGSIDLMAADPLVDVDEEVMSATAWNWLVQTSLRKWLLGSGLALIGVGLFLFRTTTTGDKPLSSN